MTPRKTPTPAPPPPATPRPGPAPETILAQTTRPDGTRVLVLITGQKIILPPEPRRLHEK